MLGCMAQHDRRVQYKPYIDLRPMHFGILVGAHLQDLEFENAGLQTITDDNGVVTAPDGYDSIGQITVAVNGANSGTVDLDDVYYYAPDFTVLAPVVTTGTYTSGGHAVYAA